MNNVHVVTLGCNKNDVDTSIMQSILDKDKYNVNENIEDSEIIIVNTCGFIESAKEESIEMILESAKYKEEGKCEKLILAGCLAQRYPKELLSEIPEVDGIIGTGNINKINEILDRTLLGERVVETENINAPYYEGIKKENVKPTEYVKISEGCNNNCSYCIIPSLRGKNRSRKIEDIKKEVEYLVKNGAQEIILIAQNTTDYGIDLYKEYSLSKLIKEISKIEKLKWIRVLYLYPDHFTEELIDEFKNNKKLLKYVDIPLQHVSDKVLKNMNRHTDYKHIKNLIKKLRCEIDGIVIRTTFIVGFPGETKEDFNLLKEFIEEYKFDKLGVFTYSREENTKAYQLDNQVSEDEKLKRQENLMQLQSKISEALLEKNINKIYTVLIEEKSTSGEYIGRTYMDSPEVDGICMVNSKEKLNIGDFVNVKIIDTLEYDLIGDKI